MSHLDARADLFHVHYTWDSSDCDGRMSGEHTYRPEEGEDAFDCWRRVSRFAIPYVAMSAELRVRCDDDSGAYVIEVAERTDEGGRWEVYETCTDRCSDRSFRRDHQAEAAGY